MKWYTNQVYHSIEYKVLSGWKQLQVLLDIMVISKLTFRDRIFGLKNNKEKLHIM